MTCSARSASWPSAMARCGWTASVTFGGPDLRTCYGGSLRGTMIPYFTAPGAGLPMVHWNERR